MKMIRNIAVAFSLYSRIPMPVFEWKEDDMKYAIAFLPLVGAIIGILEYFLCTACDLLNLPVLCKIALFSVLPILVTGGFHVDGYMDVQDALHSYQSKEEKLKILKDPHIGAFSVISLLVYISIWVATAAAFFSKQTNLSGDFFTICILFFEVRAVTAITSLVFPHAKNGGMLHEETKIASNFTLFFSIVEGLVGIVVIGFISIKTMIISIIVLGFFTLFYYKKCLKEFGGVTGDTAGFFVTLGELIVFISVTFSIFLPYNF